jgi:hypothetical protein
MAYVGVAGFITAVANYTSRLLAPSIAEMIMPLNGLLWFIWWIMASVGLFKLARDSSDQTTESIVDGA